MVVISALFEFGCDRVARTLGMTLGPDEILGAVVRELLDQSMATSSWYCTGGDFMKLRRRTHDWPADATVEGDLGAANRVDDDARRIRGVPYFELELDVEGTSPKLRPSMRM